MSSSRLSDRLFTFLWQRYVEGRSAEEAAEAAGLSPDVVARHRARRSPAYEAAEALLDERLPAVMLSRYARALQARVLLTKEDATAAGVAKAVLEDAQESDRPTAIAFVIEDFDATRDVDVPQAAGEASFVTRASRRRIAAAPDPGAGFLKARPSSVAGALEYVSAAKAAPPPTSSSDQPLDKPTPAPAKTKPAPAPKHRASPRKTGQPNQTPHQQ